MDRETAKAINDLSKKMNAIQLQLDNYFVRLHDNNKSEIDINSADIDALEIVAVENTEDIATNSDGLFDVAEMSSENSDAIYDLADYISELETRIAELEGKNNG